MTSEERPTGVPASACRSPKGNEWALGEKDDAGRLIGARRWSDRGVLLAEESHSHGSVTVTTYRRDGGTRLATYTLEAKRLVGDASTWRRDGTLSLRASFEPQRATLEHLGPDGAIMRHAEYGRVSSATLARVAEPTEDDRLVLDAIGEGDASAVDAATGLSPAGMGHAIAQGWGGDADRDAHAARLTRRLVRKVASPSLREKIARLALDRSPRWQTPQRVDADVLTLAEEPSVDGEALREAVIAAGGPGVMFAVSTPGRAQAYLESRLEGDTLKLAHLGLTALPAEIGRFHHTPRLYAEGNRLETLPDEVGDMFRLAWLNLSSNRITWLPRSLAGLPELRTLYLSKNDLSAIPRTVFELGELRTLSIGDNELTDIPEAIGDMTSLDDLSLYGNKLRDLPRSLSRLPLTFLHLGDHEWAEPPAVVGELSTLETLWIASRALERLTEAIVRLPNLKRLMLWYSNVSEVPKALFEAKQLRELRISNNPLPAGTLEALKEALPDCKIY